MYASNNKTYEHTIYSGTYIPIHSSYKNCIHKEGISHYSHCIKNKSVIYIRRQKYQLLVQYHHV